MRANHNSAGSEYTQIFSTLAKNLSVKGFIYEAIGSGKLNNLSQIKSGLRYFEVAGVNEPSFVGSTDSNNYLDLAAVTSEKATWIVTEDNMAYTVVSYQNTSNKICESKLEINSHITSPEEVKKHVCFTVVVDVNGLNKSPNVVEPQITKTLAASDTLDTLTGDQYYIFIGRDGATAGNPKFTATGRLVGDVK